ncbi:MAG: hypothetical protein M0Z79_02530 [Nitrospiraceae bacterium]|nr:hypothetical protein [Nitrospiraceae bacterium]
MTDFRHIRLHPQTTLLIQRIAVYFAVIRYLAEIGRLKAIIDSNNTFAYQYDSAGRRIKLSYPNGTTANYAYDSSGRLTSLVHKTSDGSIISSFSYALDKVGNRLTKVEPETKYSYGYDNIYQLLQAVPTKLKDKEKEKREKTSEEKNKAETYVYDPVGNRLTGPQVKDMYAYNNDNQLTDDSKHHYEYDRNGNLVKKTEMDEDGKTAVTTYAYDYENRLIKVVKQNEDEVKTITFKYDPLGRRIEKKVEEGEHGKSEDTKTYTYVYDNQAIILEYLTKTDDGKPKTEKTRYIQGLGVDEHLAVINGKDVYYYHADGLGSVIALTDGNGKTVQTYQYDSFGNLKDQNERVKQPYTFTGREWDKETGLYYYRARYYDATVGRFLSFDPILHPTNGPPTSCGRTALTLSFGKALATPLSINPFIYTLNNPVNLTDPSGLVSTNCSCDHVTCRLVAFPNLYICFAKVFCTICRHDIPGLEYIGMYYLTPGGSLSILFECDDFPPPSGPVS